MTILNIKRPHVVYEHHFSDYLIDGLNEDGIQHNKYIPIESKKLFKFGHSARLIIGIMENYLLDGFKSTLVDYRVVDLKAGDCGCKLDNWHIDVVRNPNHKSRPDRHLIFSTIIGTEFIDEPLECNTDDFSDINTNDVAIWSAPVNSIVIYNRFHLHRGPIVKEDCRRVLIRITQTDVF